MATIASRVPWGTSRETPVSPVLVAFLVPSIRTKELREIRPVNLAKRGKIREAQSEIPSVLSQSLRYNKRARYIFIQKKKCLLPKAAYVVYLQKVRFTISVFSQYLAWSEKKIENPKCRSTPRSQTNRGSEVLRPHPCFFFIIVDSFSSGSRGCEKCILNFFLFRRKRV